MIKEGIGVIKLIEGSWSVMCKESMCDDDYICSLNHIVRNGSIERIGMIVQGLPIKEFYPCGTFTTEYREMDKNQNNPVFSKEEISRLKKEEGSLNGNR